MQIIAKNKKAYFDYNILDKIEAGIVLRGSEIKAARAHQASIKGSFAKILSGDKNNPELFLINSHFSIKDGDPERTKKLLVHRRQIAGLIGKIQQKGLTLIPLTLYFKRGKLKVELGMSKGKQKFDKRAALKKRSLERELTNF